MTDITYYRNMEPLFGAWRIIRLIGEGSFGKVFEIEREDFGRKYTSALKVISIPQNESELRSAMADGMTSDSLQTYYRDIVNEIVDEFTLMAELKGVSNIVSYEDHQVVERTDRFGWDILIRMELLTPLSDHIANAGMTRRDIAQLGIDLCKALELCKKQNIIHRDIKPENIFVSKNGDYKLGDFGIAKTVEKTTGSFSQKGTPLYMAPEIFRSEAYGASVDIYSLGLVLFRLLNNNRVPFLPLYPAPMLSSDRESALQRRLSGAELPCPVHADEEMLAIIRKASAFSPADRYTSPTEMRADLERILERQDDSQPVCVGEVFCSLSSMEELAEESQEFSKTSPVKNKVVNPPVPVPPPEEEKKSRRSADGKKKKKPIIPILLAVAVTAALVTLGVLLLRGGNEPNSGEESVNTFASMLWGEYIINDYTVDEEGNNKTDFTKFMENMEYEDLLDYNLSCVPYEIVDCGMNTGYRYAQDDWDQLHEEFLLEYKEKYWENCREVYELNTIKVSFVDQTGRSFTATGIYKVEGNKLLVCYDYNIGGISFKLTTGDWIEYTFSFEGCNLILERNGCRVKMVPRAHAVVKPSMYLGFIGSGYAVSPEDIYQSIAGVSWSMHPDYKRVDVLFADGGTAIEPSLVFDEEGNVVISWTGVTRKYNGRYRDYNEPGSVTAQYIHCGDWGFILVADGKYYRYQNSATQFEEASWVQES